MIEQIERPQADQYPEGVYRDPRGRLVHDRLRFRGFFTEGGEPWKSDEDGVRYEHHDEVPHPCVVPPAHAEVDEIERLRQGAANKGHDFLHPTYGWLSGGRKRTQEYPENLGAGAVRRTRRVTAAPVEHPLDDATGATVEAASAPSDVATAISGRRSRRGDD